jgi:hypothetical protein
MRNYILILAVIFFSLRIYSQTNLVQNPGFEAGNYNGGSDPINHYSGIACNAGRLLLKQKLMIGRWLILVQLF